MEPGGSRERATLSDRLTTNETHETMRNEEIKLTFDPYTITEEGGAFTIQDDARRVALQFDAGDTMARYNCRLMVSPEDMATPEGVAMVTETADQLTEYAATRWPDLFHEIQ